MTKSDFHVLTNFLHALYAERFPGLTPEMAQLWYDDLQGFDATLVTRGAKRWARHHTLKAPTLDELVESVEWIVDQDRRSRLPAKPTNPLDLITAAQQRYRDASPASTTADSVFGKLMIKLMTKHATHEEGYRTLADCAAQCMTLAQYYRPKSQELAGWLDDQSVIYQRLAQREEEWTPTAHPRTTMPRLGEARGVETQGCVHEPLNAQGACPRCLEVLEEVPQPVA